MRDLIARLTVADDDTATALRVISHFDTLVERGSTTMAMLRAAAALAGCPAGCHDASVGSSLWVGVDGQGHIKEVAGIPVNALTVELDLLTVWLERDGGPGPLDRLILERCARSIKTIAQVRDVRPAVTAVRVACDSQSTPTDRRSALLHLGLGRQVTIAATLPHEATALPPGPVIEGQRINLLRPEQADALVPSTDRAGITDASSEQVHQMWRKAATALRLAIDPATGRPTRVRYEQLGSLAAVAERFDADSAAAVPDVRRIEELRGERSWVVALVGDIVAHSSIRQIARREGLHHSTVIERIAWLEHRLGYTLRDAAGQTRSSVTLVLWRVAAAGGQFSPSPVRDAGSSSTEAT